MLYCLYIYIYIYQRVARDQIACKVNTTTLNTLSICDEIKI